MPVRPGAAISGGGGTARYLPPDKVRAYIEFADAELGAQVAIYLRPERWLTADLRRSRTAGRDLLARSRHKPCEVMVGGEATAGGG